MPENLPMMIELSLAKCPSGCQGQRGCKFGSHICLPSWHGLEYKSDDIDHAPRKIDASKIAAAINVEWQVDTSRDPSTKLLHYLVYKRVDTLTKALKNLSASLRALRGKLD
jgi:hypothetical protein